MDYSYSPGKEPGKQIVLFPYIDCGNLASGNWNYVYYKRYPQGLKRNGVLLESRIIGIADVVEAMTNHRPYRESLGLETALSEIENNKEVLFDPEATDACIRFFLEKGSEIGRE